MKVLLFANTDWYLFNFRLGLMQHLKRSGVEVVAVSPNGDFGRELVERGIRWIPVDMDRKRVNPFAEMKVIREIVDILRQERPDIVHNFTFKPVVYGTLAARIACIPGIVNAVTGLGYLFIDPGVRAGILRNLVLVVLRRLLATRKAVMILQNPDDYELFKNLRICDQQRMTIIRGSGVDTDRFIPATRDRANGKVRVLMATRLLWDKGLQEYHDAAVATRRRTENVEFFLAGPIDEGNPSAAAGEAIRAWAEAGVLEYLGNVLEMPRLLSDMDIVVLPSYREGTPKILLEAAASGLPIVATDATGCREAVLDGVTGTLVPVQDAETLSKAILELVENPGKRASMGASGRRFIVDNFSEQSVIARTVEQYDRLLKPGAPVVSRRGMDRDTVSQG